MVSPRASAVGSRNWDEQVVMEILRKHIFYDERDTFNACAWIRDHLQYQQAVSNVLKFFSESWR